MLAPIGSHVNEKSRKKIKIEKVWINGGYLLASHTIWPDSTQRFLTKLS